MQPHQDLVQRIERLERENRRLKLSGGACVLALVGAVACGTSSSPSESEAPPSTKAGQGTLVAQEIVLRAADGGDVARLGVDDMGYPFLTMNKGERRAILTLNGPGLLMRGDGGHRSAFMGFDSSQATRLELTSNGTLDGLRLAVQADGSAGVYARDRQGRERASLEYLSTGLAQLTARDANGRVQGVLGYEERGVSHMLLLDGAGRRRAGLVVDHQADGAPFLELDDAEARARAKLSLGSDGTPDLVLTRFDGQPAFRAP
jgi:hypothetical protein